MVLILQPNAPKNRKTKAGASTNMSIYIEMSIGVVLDILFSVLNV